LIILIFVLAVGRRLSHWEGLQFYLVVVLYTLLRFIVELTRHFDQEEMVGPLTHNQVVCVALFLFFGFLALWSLSKGPGPRGA
jgi:prolipoprotein diacylglyceryltransferase